MFTFDGYNIRNYVDKVNNVERPVLPSREHTVVDIPGMAGAILARSKTGVRSINVTVQIFGQTRAEIRRKTEKLAEVLMTEEVAPLVFTDEPHKTYYAIVAEETSLEELSVLGKAEITFLCPDPFARGLSHSDTMTYNETGIKTVSKTIAGTTATLPKFTASFSTTGTYCEFRYKTKKVRVIYNFKAGDTLVIDHESNLITVNGSVNNQTITLDSDLFDMLSGVQEVTVDTDGTVITNLDYTERWL